ncbi:MAG: hypothetical protein AAB733_01820 [Patescibacteria group bacterium]
MTPTPIKKILTLPRIQIDLLVAIILLRRYGRDVFPGIEHATLEFRSTPPEGKTPEDVERLGILLLDLGGGRFDHHAATEEHASVTTLVARTLGIFENKELSKLFQFVERDEVKGQGIISKDPLDRAFGLSGLLMSLNWIYQENPATVVDLLVPVLTAHIDEQYRRNVLFPTIYQELREKGDVILKQIRNNGRVRKVAFLRSDVQGLVGFLRAYRKVDADLVVQCHSSGHTNLISKQTQRLLLGRVVVRLRSEELRLKGKDLTLVPEGELEQSGRMNDVPEWYYDTVTNSIQNGGVALDQVSATQIPFEKMIEIVTAGMEDLAQEQGAKREPVVSRPSIAVVSSAEPAMKSTIPRKLEPVPVVASAVRAVPAVERPVAPPSSDVLKIE